MASADQIKALVQSHLARDDAQFLSIAMQVAAYEARRGHSKLAEELRSMVDAAKVRRAGRELLGRDPVPISKPRGELAGLVSVSYPKQALGSMITSDPVRDRLERIIREQQHFQRIREHGLSPRRRLLLTGPPGTGKTLTASVLAGELSLPLFLVRLEALISKFLGETAAKLRLIFDAVRDTRGVYFFDEFDAIASRRGMANEVGEIRRVLNSFLQFIEHDESNSLIVAATNHPELLDHAVYRRFDDVIEYQMPDADQALEALRARLRSFATKTMNWRALAAAADGLSFAEITRAADEAIKEAIIHERSSVSHVDVQRALSERMAMRPAQVLAPQKR
ncbi:MAG TPA: ATP-binding protein [Steroidobacteraceae bacterium]|nr:ATP-binding protein [Steroidobacteraceae bacterium]